MNKFDAFCFGELSTLVLSGEEGLLWKNSERDQEPVPCRQGEVEWLKELDPQYSVLLDTTLRSAESELAKESQQQSALFFMLASLDANLSVELRIEAAEVADEFLSKANVSSWVEQVMLSKPISASDKVFSLRLDSLAAWENLKEKIALAQPALRGLWRAWEVLQQSETLISGDINFPGLLDELLQENSMSTFAQAIAKGDIGSFNKAIIDFSLNPARLKERQTNSLALAKLRTILQDADLFHTPVATLFGSKEDSHSKPSERARFSNHPDLSNHEMFSMVRKQIEGIRKLLLVSNRSVVDKAVGELLAFHQHHGEKEHLAKSLCALTTIALEANEPHIANTLSLRALSLEVDDVVVYNNRAEVLKQLGRLAEAQNAYEEVLKRYGTLAYALCGYADVLKDRGDFETAMKVYTSAHESFPDDPVPSNGIVGVLVAQEKMEEALSRARFNAERFSDVVSRGILGGILRQMGRYAESVRILEAVVRDFPFDRHAWYGIIRSLRYAGESRRALEYCDEYQKRFPDYPAPLLVRGETLRAMGRFEESLEVYSKTLRQFPEHRPAQIGKASILLLLDRYQEAQVTLNNLELESELDWLAFHALCMAKLRAGDVDAAIEDLEWGRANAPWNRTKSYFAASLGLANYKKGQLSHAANLFTEGMRYSDQEKKNVLLLLLGSLRGQTGGVQIGKNLIHMTKPTNQSGRSIKAFLELAGRKSFDSKILQFSPDVERAVFESFLAAA